MKRTAMRAISTAWAAAVLAVVGTWADVATGGVPPARAEVDGADVALVAICRQQVVKSKSDPARISVRFLLTVRNVGTAATDGDKLLVGTRQLQKSALVPVPPGLALEPGKEAEVPVTWDGLFRQQPFRQTIFHPSEGITNEDNHSPTFAPPHAVPQC